MPHRPGHRGRRRRRGPSLLSQGQLIGGPQNVSGQQRQQQQQQREQATQNQVGGPTSALRERFPQLFQQPSGPQQPVQQPNQVPATAQERVQFGLQGSRGLRVPGGIRTGPQRTLVAPGGRGLRAERVPTRSGGIRTTGRQPVAPVGGGEPTAQELAQTAGFQGRQQLLEAVGTGGPITTQEQLLAALRNPQFGEDLGAVRAGQVARGIIGRFQQTQARRQATGQSVEEAIQEALGADPQTGLPAGVGGGFGGPGGAAGGVPGVGGVPGAVQPGAIPGGVVSLSETAQQVERAVQADPSLANQVRDIGTQVALRRQEAREALANRFGNIGLGGSDEQIAALEELDEGFRQQEQQLLQEAQDRRRAQLEGRLEERIVRAEERQERGVQRQFEAGEAARTRAFQGEQAGAERGLRRELAGAELQAQQQRAQIAAQTNIEEARISATSRERIAGQEARLRGQQIRQQAQQFGQELDLRRQQFASGRDFDSAKLFLQESSQQQDMEQFNRQLEQRDFETAQNFNFQQAQFDESKRQFNDKVRLEKDQTARSENMAIYMQGRQEKFQGKMRGLDFAIQKAMSEQNANQAQVLATLQSDLQRENAEFMSSIETNNRLTILSEQFVNQSELAEQAGRIQQNMANYDLNTLEPIRQQLQAKAHLGQTFPALQARWQLAGEASRIYRDGGSYDELAALASQFEGLFDPNNPTVPIIPGGFDAQGNVVPGAGQEYAQQLWQQLNMPAGNFNNPSVSEQLTSRSLTLPDIIGRAQAGLTAADFFVGLQTENIKEFLGPDIAQQVPALDTTRAVTQFGIRQLQQAPIFGLTTQRPTAPTPPAAQTDEQQRIAALLPAP